MNQSNTIGVFMGLVTALLVRIAVVYLLIALMTDVSLEQLTLPMITYFNLSILYLVAQHAVKNRIRSKVKEVMNEQA